MIYDIYIIIILAQQGELCAMLPGAFGNGWFLGALGRANMCIYMYIYIYI